MEERHPKNYISVWAITLLWVGIYVFSSPVIYAFHLVCKGLTPHDYPPAIWEFVLNCVYGNVWLGSLIVLILSLLFAFIAHKVIHKAGTDSRKFDLLIFTHIVSALILFVFIACLAAAIAVLFIPEARLWGQNGGLIPYRNQ